jgi:hypothetical protein
MPLDPLVDILNVLVVGSESKRIPLPALKFKVSILELETILLLGVPSIVIVLNFTSVLLIVAVPFE